MAASQSGRRLEPDRRGRRGCLAHGRPQWSRAGVGAIRQGRVFATRVALALTVATWSSGHVAARGLAAQGLAARGLATTGPPAQPYYRVTWGLTADQQLRYNRAEGLYVGVAATRTLGHLRLVGTLGFASTDPVPQSTLGAAWREGDGAEIRGVLFHRIEAVDPTVHPFGLGNALTALLAGRDEGEYVRVTGAELSVAASPIGPEIWKVRVYFERHAPPKGRAGWSLIGWPFVSYRGRALAPVDRLRQVGLEAVLRTSWDRQRARPWGDIEIQGRVETGSARLAQSRVTGRLGLGVPSAIGATVGGGIQVSAGEVPTQRYAVLGGPSRVRGFAGAALSGSDAAWVNVELSRRIRWVTAFGFVDWGWAGGWEDRSATPSIRSAGTGIAVLDDALRAHVAWPLAGGPGKARLDIYVNRAGRRL